MERGKTITKKRGRMGKVLIQVEGERRDLKEEEEGRKSLRNMEENEQGV